MSVRILHGDCRAILATLPPASVQCCVTSPPYYGLRDYGTAQWDGGDAACDHKQSNYDRGERATRSNIMERTTPYRDACGKCGATRIDRQIGLEPSPDEYLATMVAVFREVRRVLRDDATCWVNMGDSYSSGSGGDKRMGDPFDAKAGGAAQWRSAARPQVGAKPKDLLMMPARLALALQADGWWLRSDIIWHKPNPMPESVTDRPTSAHEHVFLLTKRATYYYDSDAVAEPATNGEMFHGAYDGGGPNERTSAANGRHRANNTTATRNARNVWTIATAPFSAAHFATFPPALAERCIRAGSAPGDTVLDPFSGAGTTALVADRLQRHAIGIELNPSYAGMACERVRADAGLFAEVSA